MSVVVYCDGASRSNPGEASIVVSITESQLEIATISKKIGVASNNVAEYQALIEGLKYCINSKVQTVCFYLDSKLVVEQIIGNFKVKSENESTLDNNFLFDKHKDFKLLRLLTLRRRNEIYKLSGVEANIKFLEGIIAEIKSSGLF